MSKNVLRIQELKQLLEPQQEKYFEALRQASKDVTEKLNKIINPAYPVSAKVGIESISFYTTTESSEKGVHYPDFGSEITLSNHYGFGNYENMENIFIPELNYGSLGMSFDEKSRKYQVTKFHILHFLSNDLLSDGEFTQFLKETFRNLRLLQKAVWKIEFELSPLVEEDKKVEIEALKEACAKALKVGNWYKGSESYVRIDKITPKKIHAMLINIKNPRKTEEYKSSHESIISMLYNRELLAGDPTKLVTA